MDISGIVIAWMAKDFIVKPGHLTKSSPLLTEHIKRSGDYYVNLKIKPKDMSYIFKPPLG
jgi:hypothetical protein